MDRSVTEVNVRSSRVRATAWVRLRIALVVALAATGLSVASSPTASADTAYLYWTDQISGDIKKADLDGTNQETWISGRSDPSALATDGTYLYWSESYGLFNPATGIYRAPIADPSAVTQIGTTNSASYGVAVNSTHVYWSDSGDTDGGVWRANLDGTSPTEIISSGINLPQGLALNDSHLFVAAFGTTTVVRAELDGANDTVLVGPIGGNGVYGLTINSTHIFYGQANDEDIGRADIDGNNPNNAFLSSIGDAYGLTTHAGNLYWAAFSGSSPGIWRSNIDGSDPSRLIATGAGPVGLIVLTETTSASASATASFADFSYFLPDGRECSSISPQRVQVGTYVELPGIDANCKSMPGSVVAGWTIPVAPGFTGAGSSSLPLSPGHRVRVIESQRFTAVTLDPVLTIEYDSNIADDDACTPANLANASENGRVGYSWVPRVDFAMSRAWDQSPCVPEGYELVGWNTAGDGSGETIDLGAPLPEGWETSTTNEHRLYAIWQSPES